MISSFFTRLKEIQNLQPRNTKGYKKGAGILALSYIDENTIMSSGYDTFIRIFDIRSNKWYVDILEFVNIYGSFFCQKYFIQTSI